MSEKNLFRLSKSCIHKLNPNGTIILISLDNPNDESYFELEQGPMSDAFLMLYECTPVPKIISEICDKYDADIDEAQKDLEGFIQELMALGLLERG